MRGLLQLTLQKMPKFSLLPVLCLATVIPFAVAEGDCAEGQFIGTLPNLAHDVSGEFFVLNDRTFCIENFNYDGMGPDAFLYFYYPNDTIDETGGGVYVPLSPTQLQFQVGRTYTNETLMFTLPMGLQSCDFEGFSIWCRYANQLFTSVTWATDEIFESIICRRSPGAFVGVLPMLDHEVSGLLYVQDNKTFVIRDFTYDGDGPDAFVYPYRVGEVVDPLGGGIIIPLPEPEGVVNEEGRLANTVYMLPQDDFSISIPENMPDLYTCDLGAFTIWCRDFFVFFTSLNISRELFSNNPLEVAYRPDLILCDTPNTRPGILIGELPTTDSRAISGTFYVQDVNTFFIQLFSYDASRDEAYLYYYPVGVSPDTTGEAGGRIAFSDDTVGRGLQPELQKVIQNLYAMDLGRAVGDVDINVCSIGYFTILDEGVGVQVTMIQIPQAVRDSLCQQPGTVTAGTDRSSLPQATILGMFGALAAAFLFLIF